MNNVDTYICEIWNQNSLSQKLVEENFWDICRLLQREKFVNSDDTAIAAYSIGPFRMASDMEVNKKDLLHFFLEIIIPNIFSRANNLGFDQVYSLYLLPAVLLLISFADHHYWIKDSLQWELILYIQNRNKIDIYPTIREIKEAREFRDIEEKEIRIALKELSQFNSILGDIHELIEIDLEGHIKCLI